MDLVSRLSHSTTRAIERFSASDAKKPSSAAAAPKPNRAQDIEEARGKLEKIVQQGSLDEFKSLLRHYDKVLDWNKVRINGMDISSHVSKEIAYNHGNISPNRANAWLKALHRITGMPVLLAGPTRLDSTAAQPYSRTANSHVDRTDGKKRIAPPVEPPKPHKSEDIRAAQVAVEQTLANKDLQRFRKVLDLYQNLIDWKLVKFGRLNLHEHVKQSIEGAKPNQHTRNEAHAWIGAIKSLTHWDVPADPLPQAPYANFHEYLLHRKRG